MIVELFKEKGIKVTKPRISIYELLQKENKSVTAEYIYNKCKEENKNINLSTVYRTLDIFEEKDLVDKLNIEDGKKSYGLKKEKHNHTVECSLCHKEIQVPCPLQQIEEVLKTQKGFYLTEHKLTLRGLCEECNEHK